MNKILSSYYNRIIKEYDDILLCYQLETNNITQLHIHFSSIEMLFM